MAQGGGGDDDNWSGVPVVKHRRGRGCPVVAGTGEYGFAGDGGAATSARLAGPSGIAVGDDGALYIGDGLNNRVRKVAPDGTISTIGGTGIRGMTGDGGPALAAEFGHVSRVQLDTDGDLLIADQTNSCIRKLLSPL